MGCCKSIVKYSLFGINLLFTILGLAITIATIVFYLQYQDDYESMFKDELMKNGFQSFTIAAGVLGLSIFIIAFCGCWGSATGKKFFLILFVILLLPLIAAKLFIVTKYYNNLDEVQIPAKEYLEEKFQNEKDNISFHIVEYTLHCCGVGLLGPHSYISYRDASKILRSHGKVPLPPSCCSEKIDDINKLIAEISKQTESIKNENKQNDTCTLDSVKAGVSCTDKVYDLIDTYGNLILKSMIGIIVVEIVEAVAAIYLCMAGKPQKGYY